MLKDQNGKELKEGDVVGVLFQITQVHGRDEYAALSLKSVEKRKPDHEQEIVMFSSSICSYVSSAEELKAEQERKEAIEAEKQARIEEEIAQGKLLERKALEAQLRAEIEAEMRAKAAASEPAPTPVSDPNADFLGEKTEEKKSKK